MKYRVTYLKPYKTNKYVEEEATLLNIESAMFWESKMIQQGAKDIKIIPV